MDGGAWWGYSPQGRKKSDMTERLHFPFSFLSPCSRKPGLWAALGTTFPRTYFIMRCIYSHSWRGPVPFFLIQYWTYLFLCYVPRNCLIFFLEEDDCAVPCLVDQSCPTLCDPMDCSLPGSSVHGISHARILEWVAVSFSRGSSRPRDRTHISCIGRRMLYHCVTWETISL